MTETNHDYDRIMKDTLEKLGQSTVNALQRKTGIPHGTFFSHWDNLKRAGQVELLEPLLNSKKSKRGQGQLYRLSESTKSKRRLGFNEKITSQRESRKPSKQNKETKEHKKKQVILFLLMSQAIGGSGRNTPRTGKQEPGDYEAPDPRSLSGNVTCFYEEFEGVTVNDLTEHRDVGNARAFAHINITESEVEDCIKTLRENELSDVIGYILREGNYNEPAFIIKDKLLQQVVKHCLVLMSYIMQMIEYRWLYIIRRRPTQGPEFEWYVSFFGEKRIDYLFSKGKMHLDQFIKDIKKLSINPNTQNKKMPDIKKEIVGHNVKQVVEAIVQQYAELCRIISNMPEKYKAILDMLRETVYPLRLQKLHDHYPEILGHKKSFSHEPALMRRANDR